MSAAKWRRAMTAGTNAGIATPSVTLPARLQLVAAPFDDARARARGDWVQALQHWFSRLSAWQIAVVAGLVIFPFVVSPFITFQIGAHKLSAGDVHIAAAGSWHEQVSTRNGVLVLLRGEYPLPSPVE